MTHLTVEGGVAAVEPALFPGKTGEFCFVGPPIAVGLAGPPTVLCAKAGSEKPLPHRRPRKTPINTARIIDHPAPAGLPRLGSRQKDALPFPAASQMRFAGKHLVFRMRISV